MPEEKALNNNHGTNDKRLKTEKAYDGLSEIMTTKLQFMDFNYINFTISILIGNKILLVLNHKHKTSP